MSGPELACLEPPQRGECRELRASAQSGVVTTTRGEPDTGPGAQFKLVRPARHTQVSDTGKDWTIVC